MAPAPPMTQTISLRRVTNESLPDLMDLHTRVFPVTYGKQFYNEVLHSGELAKIIYFNNQYAGAICCRLERSKVAAYTADIYMMTLGVLKDYRSLGLGTILLQHIIEFAKSIQDPIIATVYLHVQTVNETAIRFYLRNGFQIHSLVQDYYKLIENRDAYILTRQIHVLHDPRQQMRLQMQYQYQQQQQLQQQQLQQQQFQQQLQQQQIQFQQQPQQQRQQQLQLQSQEQQNKNQY